MDDFERFSGVVEGHAFKHNFEKVINNKDGDDEPLEYFMRAVRNASEGIGLHSRMNLVKAALDLDEEDGFEEVIRAIVAMCDKNLRSISYDNFSDITTVRYNVINDDGKTIGGL